MYTSLGLEVTLDCGCGGASALARIEPSAPCAHCAAAIPIDWRSMLRTTFRGEDIDVLDIARVSRGETFVSSSPSLRARITVEDPRCACGASVAHAWLAAIHFRTTQLACSACQAPLAARLLRASPLPNARWAVAELPEIARALPAGRVRQCAACGAPRATDAPCTFCGAITESTLGAARSTDRFFVVLRDEDV